MIPHGLIRQRTFALQVQVVPRRTFRRYVRTAKRPAPDVAAGVLPDAMAAVVAAHGVSTCNAPERTSAEGRASRPSAPYSQRIAGCSPALTADGLGWRGKDVTSPPTHHPPD